MIFLKFPLKHLHISKCLIRKKTHFQVKVNLQKRYSNPKIRDDELKAALSAVTGDLYTFSISRNISFLWLDAYHFSRRKTRKAVIYCVWFLHQQSLSQLGCFIGIQIQTPVPRNKSMGLE